MYEQFFGFTERPFDSVPRVDRYFPASAIENARQTLVRCIERAEGCGMIVGPAGSGKTLLCHILAQQFGQQMSPVVLSNARMTSRKELLQAILYELQMPYRHLQEGEMRLSLVDYLTPGPGNCEALLLIVDEAHALSLMLFEELRLLTNLVRGGIPRVRLVLAGAPLLEERFAHPKLVSLNQRLVARCYLETFTSQETRQFVRSQTAAAGGDPEQCWSEDALSAIHQNAGGVPRLINQICDHALVLAASADRMNIGQQEVEVAWADLQQLPCPSASSDEPGVDSTSVVEFGTLEDSDTQDDSLSAECVDAAEDSGNDDGAWNDHEVVVSDALAPVADESQFQEEAPQGMEAGDEVPLTDHAAMLQDGHESLGQVEVDFSDLEADSELTPTPDTPTCDFKSNEIVLRNYASLEADNVVRLTPEMRPLSLSGISDESHDQDQTSDDHREQLHEPETGGEALPASDNKSSVLGDAALIVSRTDPGMARRPPVKPEDSLAPESVQNRQFVTMSTLMSGAIDAGNVIDSVGSVQNTEDHEDSDSQANSHVELAADDACEGTTLSDTTLSDTAEMDEQTDLAREAEHPLIPVRPREYQQLFATLRNRHANR